MASKPNIPPVLWAQRKDTVYLCLDLQDVKEEKITLEATKLNFKGKSHGKDYEVNIEFFDEVNPQGKNTKYVIRPRSVEFVIEKKKSAAYWDRLTKEKGKWTWLKVDWNKWKDEDEVDEEQPGFDMSGMENFDFSALQGGEDEPGVGENEEDSDEDDLPDLDTPEKKQ
mmetsp:Transcript_18316/g.25664  ORF Transcript_18316/g.25664 Transcript_18316/m.25664 type:complete len:168 (+) Transcript_18316:44-547(+)